MESKYYTPEIEEFRVGFEYEQHTMTKGDFFFLDLKTGKKELIQENNEEICYKMVHKSEPLSDRPFEIQQIINAGNIRVKYLDREDIESLGWKFDKQHAGLDDMTFFKDDYILDTEDENNVRIYEGTCGNELNLFDGTIKNKSELKVLLKQLGI